MQQFPQDVTQANNYRQYLYWSLGIFLLYVLIRAVAWNNTVLLEDTDSLGNIRWIKVFMTFDLDKIIDIDPDFTPFYLFFSSLFSFFTGSVETGARLCSLVFSIILLISVAGIGKYITKPYEVALGLLLISFSPPLISLSFALLTEPSYIATVYLGMWLFWRQYKKPSLGNAVLLGVVFALAFLNRIEGLIFLAVIPFFQVLHFFFSKERPYDFRQLALWVAVFIVIFSAVIAPQIWRVSNIVGEFALNGRQVWNIVENEPDGKSYGEKIHGLDYSASERNIIYLKRHPEAWKEKVSSFNMANSLSAFVDNLKDLKRNRWQVLIGFIATIFFIFGAIALYRGGQWLDLLFILAFIGACLVPPLLHSVWIRHIAVIAPLILLVAGVGMIYAARLLAAFAGTYSRKVRLSVPVLSVVFLLLTVGAWAQQLREAVFNPPTFNKEYSWQEIGEPVRIVKDIIKSELKREPVIVAQTGYLAHYAGARQVYLPHADMAAMLKYAELNDIDFLYLQHKRIDKYPFYQQYLAQGLPENYRHLYSGVDARGGKVELYRVLRDDHRQQGR